MVSTTRSRASLFMNKFRKLGFVTYIGVSQFLAERGAARQSSLQEALRLARVSCDVVTIDQSSFSPAPNLHADLSMGRRVMLHLVQLTALTARDCCRDGRCVRQGLPINLKRNEWQRRRQADVSSDNPPPRRPWRARFRATCRDCLPGMDRHSPFGNRRPLGNRVNL
jgi:hypothetical protein